jgi:hypothetical protein
LALNFPDNPSVNQIFSDATSGFYYKWDGQVWQSFSPGSSANIQILDDVSGSFNGITTSFSLASNGNTITPINSQQLVINLGGVVQDPSDDYAVSGSNIIFSDPPDLGASFSGISLGPAIPISNILDGSIFPQDLSTGGPWWQSDYKVGIGTTIPTSLLDVEGNVIIAGITTINAGLAGTALVVQGNARITGILTVGTASITFNGNTNTASIGTSRIVAIPAGSSTVWYQPTAPTGWTKITTHHDKCLRIVNTTGGSSGGITSFTSVFTSKTPTGSVSGSNSGGSVENTTATGSVSGSNSGGSVSNTTATGSVSGSNSGGSVNDTTLSTNQIPTHNHLVPTRAGQRTTGSQASDGQVEYIEKNNTSPSGNAGLSGSHTHGFNNPSWSGSFTGTSHGHTFNNPSWSGSVSINAHNHSLTQPSWSGSFSGSAMDFAVQYVDLILCSID